MRSNDENILMMLLFRIILIVIALMVPGSRSGAPAGITGFRHWGRDLTLDKKIKKQQMRQIG
jgi:hypothetical protein